MIPGKCKQHKAENLSAKLIVKLARALEMPCVQLSELVALVDREQEYKGFARVNDSKQLWGDVT